MDPIEEFLSRAVANIIPSQASLTGALESGKKLNVYLGIDPTSVHIHLGHAVILRKLQQLVGMGHHVTFLIGDSTALIGDTSDKDSERPVLTPPQIEANFATYKDQAAKILDFSAVTVRRNSEWLKKLTFEDIILLARHFSLNDFISRELIKTRLASGRSVSLPEVLYPVMQGYDSYFMDTDLQIGGTDQTFNMQAGRTLQKDLRNKDTFVLTTPFLAGTDGRKMSKSWGNAIWLDDSATDIYGKVMSLHDDLIVRYFTLATNMPLPQVADIEAQILGGTNPMNFKKDLAYTLVKELHGPAAASSTQSQFESTFQHNQAPENLPPIYIDASGNLNIIAVLVQAHLVTSKSEARRLVEQGAVELDGKKVLNASYLVDRSATLKIGSRRFAKILVQ